MNKWKELAGYHRFIWVQLKVQANGRREAGRWCRRVVAVSFVRPTRIHLAFVRHQLTDFIVSVFIGFGNRRIQLSLDRKRVMKIHARLNKCESQIKIKYFFGWRASSLFWQDVCCFLFAIISSSLLNDKIERTHSMKPNGYSSFKEWLLFYLFSGSPVIIRRKGSVNILLDRLAHFVLAFKQSSKHLIYIRTSKSFLAYISPRFFQHFVELGSRELIKFALSLLSIRLPSRACYSSRGVHRRKPFLANVKSTRN